MQIAYGASDGKYAIDSAICEEATRLLYTMNLRHVRCLVVNTQVYTLSILGEDGATVARIGTIYGVLGN